MRKLYLLAFICLGLWSPLNGQSTPPILLQSGVLKPSDNLEEFLAAPIGSEEAIGGFYYRLIRFAGTPGQHIQQEMRRSGLRLQAYIPHHTYLVAIPVNWDRTRLYHWGVKGVYRLQANHKLQKRLAQGDYPNWALQDHTIELIVRFRPEMAGYRFRQLLLQKGAKVEKQIEGEGEMHIRCPLNKLQEIASLEAVLFIEAMPEPGKPEDIPGRNLQRSNYLSSTAPLGRQYDGTGIGVMVRDDGEVGPHIDFHGRIDQSQLGGADLGNHGDGVAGVMAGAGNLNPLAKGGASGSKVWVLDYDFSFTDNTVLLHQTQGVMITNSSYSDGCNSGYTTNTQRVDRQAYQNPSLMHVFSAGNSNPSDCGYGAGAGWGNITGGHKSAKNVIATANLDAQGNLINSSSRGPAKDGRIKPDMAAHGQGELSTGPSNSYQLFGGTSAAAPTGAGLLAQLYHAYRDLNNQAYPTNALIKAIAMNTAQDLGNPGPDFQYGWGLYDGRRAVEVLEENRYVEDSLSQNEVVLSSLTIPAGMREARIMLYWTDWEGALLSAKSLVNDLDLCLISPNGDTLRPLVLDPTPNPITLNLPATPGIDTLNNVEQVRLIAPPTGTYQVVVMGKEVPMGPQAFVVTHELIVDELRLTYPIGGEAFVPSAFEMIHWDAYGDNGQFSLEISFDDGQSWTLIDGNIPGDQRTYQYIAPNQFSGQCRMRIARLGQQSTSPDPFSISPIPMGLVVSQVCPTYTRLNWNAVPGATAYDVFVLGQRFMDSVGTSSTNTIDIPGLNPTVAHWFSVRARGPNALRGRRANATFHPAGFLNCNISRDLNLSRIAEPSQYYYRLCEDSLAIEFWLINEGVQAETTIPVHYRFGPNIQVNELFQGNIPPGDSIMYQFNQKLDLSYFNGFGGDFELQIWQDQLSDENSWNDTLRKDIRLLEAVMSPIVREDFESFPLCGTLNDCGATICDLSNGWHNVRNQQGDDIDWRTHQGPTLSPTTGPDQDHFPGQVSGKYLYLESSLCTAKSATLLSPCIDLTASIDPKMSFWYHMWGADIGELRVDLFDGISWQNDIISPLQGPQSPNWLEKEIDLQPYIGEVIQLRFHGKTGFGWNGDIALDNIFIYDLGLPPLVDFRADKKAVCTGETVSFQEQTSPGIVSFQWSFTPNTVSFLNGTSAFSARPEVSFNLPGLYEVELMASTNLATNTLIRQNFVSVSDMGTSLNVYEDFESIPYQEIYWEIENPDSSLGFQTVTAIGPDASFTQVIFVNNALYINQGERDYLVSDMIDLSGIQDPWLSFDLAHAPHSINHVDSLQIEVSLDCGASWQPTSYRKYGAGLGTVGYNPISWAPDSASHWRRDSLDLSTWSGQSIKLRFVNINQFGNNLFLDNIHLEATPTASPNAFFFSDAFQVCEGSNINFTNQSSAVGASYLWDFGQDAIPATSTIPGPHQVVWSSPGTKTISLTVTNPLGSNTYSQQVQIDPKPLADFAYAYINNHEVSFNNLSQHHNVQFWDFGDGSSSTLFSPSHSYQNNGTYRVNLLIGNGCNTDTLTQYVVISGITAPLAAFNPTTSTVCEGSSITFNNQSQGIGITDYLWDFGPDAIPASANTAGPHTVVYQSSGPRTVSLSVTNGTGTTVQTAAISVDPLPLTDFSYNQSSVNTFIFANSSQYSSSYLWSFGDGSTATNVAPTYSYLANGTYNVKLITANHCGMDSLEQTIGINGITAPMADFGVNSDSICLGDSLIVLDQTQGIGIQAYDWRFGADAFPAISNGPGPHLVLYQSPGIKQIILGVANAEGVSRDTLYIKVREKANADFTASWQGGQNWSFAQDAPIAETQYLWDFGDGQQSVQPAPVHAYAQPGAYTVRLITSHECGRDTAYQTITDASVGLGTGFAEHSIVVAPNPCQEQFTVMVEGPAIGNLELQLWDAKGTSVRRSRLQHQGAQTQQTIETASLAEGLYLLQISSGSKRYLQRVVVY